MWREDGTCRGSDIQEPCHKTPENPSRLAMQEMQLQGGLNPWWCLTIVGITIIAGTLYLASLSETDWIFIQTANHPPVVNISRDGYGVYIRWYGGWSDSFIDHVKVTCTGCPKPEQKYVSPKPGMYIHTPFVSPNSTVMVFVYDRAVQDYHRIASVKI